MNIVGGIILVIAMGVVFTASRRFAILGVFAGVLFLTQGQSFDIGGFNVFGMRFIELAACVRVLSRGEFVSSDINKLDKAVLILYIFTTVVFLIRSSVDFAYQIGIAVDASLLYFSFRGLMRTVEDFQQFLKDFVFLLAPFAALVLVETLTTKNPFSSMGGVSYGDWSRDGRARCYGSFRHPSLLGTLGATFFPLYIGQWLSKTHRPAAAAGLFLCTFIVWASNSGGPLSCLAFGLVGWALWPMRTNMRRIRWTIVLGVTALALVMKAPIWYLPARVSSFTGGTGWHRSYLMEMAAKNFGQWGLGGMAIKETSAWFPYQLTTTGGADITNQFLAFGLSGGVLSIVILIVILVRAYKFLGNALISVRSGGVNATQEEFMLWALGAMLTAHVANWLGISYFDQTIAVWLFHLSLISSLCVLRRSEIAPSEFGDVSAEITNRELDQRSHV
ncbi:MAG: hypothetical protein ABIZ04_12145 [Opitutus sp.]